MKIGVHADAVTHSIPGGTGAYVSGLLRELLFDEADDEYVLLVSRGATLPEGWKGRASVERARLPLRALYPAWNYARLPPLRSRLEIVHATAPVVPPARKAALVATVHDFAVERFPEVVPTPWRQLYRRGLRRVLTEAAVVCANSEATRQEVLSSSRLDPARVIVTPLAGSLGPESPRDEGALARLGIARPFILHVGTLEPRKDQAGLVDAFAHAAGELVDHSLVLAGSSGWGRGEIEAAVARHGLGSRVILTGSVTSEALAALYASADVFALPSRYEGFGIPVLEAFGFGVPVVVTDVPALVEVAGDAALTVAGGDTDALAAALVSLATDSTLRADLASRGRARAAEFSWSRTADATRRAYALAGR